MWNFYTTTHLSFHSIFHETFEAYHMYAYTYIYLHPKTQLQEPSLFLMHLWEFWLGLPCYNQSHASYPFIHTYITLKDAPCHRNLAFLSFFYYHDINLLVWVSGRISHFCFTSTLFTFLIFSQGLTRYTLLPPRSYLSHCWVFNYFTECSFPSPERGRTLQILQKAHNPMRQSYQMGMNSEYQLDRCG